MFSSIVVRFIFNLEPSPFVQAIVDFVEGLVKNLEEKIPDWDASASLEKNIITLVDKPLEAGAFPGWNPDASIQDNLVNALETKIRSLKIKDFDETKTVSENLNVIVVDLLNSIPFPCKSNHYHNTI